LSEEFALFRSPPLAAYALIIYLDATFISTQRQGYAKPLVNGVLAVKLDFIREVAGIYNALTASASTWQDIVSNLKSRGLQRCHLFVSDGWFVSDD
jgi:putative transposase